MHCFIGDGPFNSRLRVMRTKKLCEGFITVLTGADGCVDPGASPASMANDEPQPGAKRNSAPQLGRHQRRRLARIARQLRCLPTTPLCSTRSSP